MVTPAPLTAAALAAAPPGAQKHMIGERLFPAIRKFQPEQAGRITGMMLEMDNSELLILLKSDQKLKAKVDEFTTTDAPAPSMATDATVVKAYWWPFNAYWCKAHLSVKGCPNSDVNCNYPHLTEAAVKTICEKQAKAKAMRDAKAKAAEG